MPLNPVLVSLGVVIIASMQTHRMVLFAFQAMDQALATVTALPVSLWLPEQIPKTAKELVLGG